MKKIFLLATTVFAIAAQAQTTQPGCYPFPKTINVTGSAQIEVIPDEIYVQVDLREYKKRGEEKISLDKIKEEFLSNCKSIGIADSNVAVASFDGYNLANMWRRRRKDPDLFASITYQIKFSNIKLIDQLVDKLDDEATGNFGIIGTSHSKITEYRKQLKIQAVKAAKDKANYLAEAVNEKVGEAITITEPTEYSASDVSNRVSNINAKMNNTSFSKAEPYGLVDGNVDFRKITLRYEVKILYSLK
jgi:uncharacterized protein